MNQYQALKETLALAEEKGLPALPGSDLGLDHMRNMFSRIKPDFSPSKLGRWLGWAQCALAAADIGVTLEDVKAINMRWSEDAPAQPGDADKDAVIARLQSELDLWRAAKHSSPALDENRELLGEVTRSLKAMLDAFGGDVPDWLSEEFAAAENAVEKVEGAKPSSDPEMEP